MNYVPIQSRFGTLWVHRCPALADGPDWARVERLAVDRHARESYIVVNGAEIHFHLHFFLQPDGQFLISDRDRAKLPADICDEVASIINSNFAPL